MEDNKISVICKASVYEKTFYWNPEFVGIPGEVKEDLRKMSTYYAEKLHCEFGFNYRENGDVFIETFAEETDYNFDEIGAKLDIDSLVKKQGGLFKSLKLWYMVFILGLKETDLDEY